MWGLMMLGGWAFAIVVLVTGLAVFAIVKIFGFAFDLWLNDPDMHRKKDDEGK